MEGLGSVSLTEQRSKLASPLASKEGEDHLLSRQPQMDGHRASPPSGLNTGLFVVVTSFPQAVGETLDSPE